MTGATFASDTGHPQDLLGQTVVVIGGSSGIGLETARLARAHGADVVLTARDPDRLRDAADQVDARSTAAFDVTDLARLEQFFEDLPGRSTTSWSRGAAPLLVPGRHGLRVARRDVDERIVVTLAVARYGAARMRPPGTLLFIGGTGGRQAGVGLTLISAMTAALPALIASLARRAGADPGQPHRRRLRRHAPVGVAPRRPARRPPRASSAPRSPSAASSDRPMSPRWRCTS